MKNDEIRLPHFRMEMEGLKQHVLHAMSQSIDAYSDQLKHSVNKAFNEFPFDLMVKRHVDNALEQAISDAAYSYFKEGAGADVIAEVLDKRAQEMIKVK